MVTKSKPQHVGFSVSEASEQNHYELKMVTPEYKTATNERE